MTSRTTPLRTSGVGIVLLLVSLGCRGPGARCIPCCTPCIPECTSCSPIMEGLPAPGMLATPQMVPVQEGVILQPGEVITTPPATVLPPGVVPAPGPAVTPVPAQGAPPLSAAPTAEKPVEQLAQHPTPPPRKSRSHKTPRALPKDLTKAAPKKAHETPEPGGLTMSADSSKTVVKPGDAFTLTITVRNQGKSAIDSVKLKASLPESLTPGEIKPEGTGKVQGQDVVFEPLRLAPMTLEFQLTLTAKQTEEKTAKITVFAESPILTEGPLTNDVVIQIEE